MRGHWYLRLWMLGALFLAAGVVHVSDIALAAPDSPREPKEDSKIDSPIRDALQKMQDMAVTRGSASGTAVSSLSVEGFLQIDEIGRIQAYIFVSASGQDELVGLENHEVEVEVVNGEFGVIQGWIPFDRAVDVATLEYVERIQAPDYAHVRIGSVTTAGDQILKAEAVRSQLGFDGSGIKVGVISDGVDSLASAQSSGDVPGGIEVDSARPGSGDEGTAMLEIVHDLAPGAQLAFSGPSTSLEMIESVNFLANTAFGGSGADIVVDDLGFLGEPYFEDGPIAQTVANVVANGTIYVSSAGNAGQQHFEGQFVAGASDFHDFGGGDTTMRVTVAGSGGVMKVFLQWNDQFGASGNDYDLFLCPAGLNPIDDFPSCFSSRALQDGNDDPFEFVIITRTAAGPGFIDIFVDGFFAANIRRLEMYILGNVTVNEFVVPGGSVFGHAAVPGAIATAAINAADPGNDTIESFSSRGPADVFFPSFESRLKPDVAAIDGVSVTGAGGFFSPFFGTSAAAPHVAGVAALVLESLRQNQPGLSKAAAATEVFDALRGTAIDLGSAGLDQTFGAGRIDAFAAATAVAVVPLPPTSVTAVAGNATATVAWIAPSSDGGSPITQYTVTSNPDGLTAAVGGSTLSAMVTGLANGTAYTFTVVATNVVGTSVPSAPSNSVVPAGPPDAPTSVTAVAGNATATVAWIAPSSDGGSPITQYTVTSNPDGLTAAVDGSTLSASVTGLANGTAYTFTAVAANVVGTSVPSPPSNSVTPTLPPPIPALSAVALAVLGAAFVALLARAAWRRSPGISRGRP